MASILIVSGSPGSGKTTLSAALANAAPRGLHLASDSFYRFPTHLVDPTTPESHAQNETIMRALARAAGVFAEGGYDVFLDGVIGPWFLPVLTGELRETDCPLEYVVLRTRLEVAVARIRGRDRPGASSRVRHMHRAFADLGDLEAHALDTTGVSEAETLARLARRRAAGEFVLPRSAP